MDKITTIDYSKYFPINFLNVTFPHKDIRLFSGVCASGKSRIVEYFWETYVDKIPMKVEVEEYE